MAIDVTGPNVGFHDLWQISILPLNYKYEKMEGLSPFSITLKPHNPLNYDPKWLKREKLVQAMGSGFDQYDAADMLQRWFDRLQLADNKKIMVLVHNWAWMRPWLINWLQPTQFAMTFHEWYRDLISVSLYANDCADAHIEQIPYPKSKFAYLCSTLKVDNDVQYDTLLAARSAAECYKHMIKRLF